MVTQKEEVNLAAERSVSNVAALTAYAWQLPESISAEVVNQPTLRFYAPAVLQPQEVLIKLTVTDALGNSADATHVLLVNPEAATQYPLWDATKVYWAGDKVSWKNQHWQAKWWNVNIEPEETGTIYPGPWGKID